MDVDAQAAPQTQPRLSWQEVTEKLKIQGCANTRVHAYWYSMDCMESTSNGARTNN